MKPLKYKITTTYQIYSGWTWDIDIVAQHVHIEETRCKYKTRDGAMRGAKAFLKRFEKLTEGSK